MNGLDNAEATWEPILSVMIDTPATVKKELKKLKVSAREKRSVRERDGLSI